MSTIGKGARFGAAAFALGLSLAGPQAVGTAVADTADTDGAAASSAPAEKQSRSTAERAAGSIRSRANTHPASRAAANRDAPSATAPTRVSARQTTAERPASRPQTDHQSRRIRPESLAHQVVPPDAPTGTGRVEGTAEPAAITAEPVAAEPSTDATVNPTPVRAASVAAATPVGAAATANADWLSGLVTPIQSFFEGIALLVRRTFFNQAPTVAPVQTTGQLTGPITGDIGAIDPEGDPLTYAISAAPRYGSVEISADGHYLYSPGAGFTGLDSFTVDVADTGFHLNLLDPSRPASTAAYLQVAQNATAPTLTFNFVYGTGSQYWSPEARGALQDAATALATYLVVSTPTTLVYTVTGENSPASGTLASAGSDLVGSGAGFFATVVQKKIQSGIDANGSAPDGEITWNFGNPWAWGSSVDTTQYDFESTAMHELLHTFGFLSYTVEPGSNTGRGWTQFDRYVVASDGTAVITASYRWNSAYDPNLTGGGGGLFFGGTNAVAAYGGLVPLFTPDPWESGSSMSHLDDDTFTGAAAMLMNAATDPGLGVRVISPVELGILKDLGYAVTAPQPAPVAALLLCFGLLRRRRVSDR